MSTYDLNAAQYEGRQMCGPLAVERTQRLHINSSSVVTPPTQALPTINTNLTPPDPTRYPAYTLGYTPGDIVVSLPPHICDPPAAADQWQTTSNHPYARLTPADLPPLLFRLEPHRDIFGNMPVPILHNSTTGQPVVTNRGATLRYFQFLPRFISWNASGALLELWFRLDYRLEMNDILMRMESGPGKDPSAKEARNNPNMKRVRFRQRAHCNSWNDARTWPGKTDLQFVGSMNEAQICFNTSMVVDLVNMRLLKAVYADESYKTVAGFVDSGLRIDSFLGDLVTTVPSRRMIATLSLRHRLQDLAVVWGRPAVSDNCFSLDARDEPKWWNDRRRGNARTQAQERAINEIDNETHSAWMESEVGRDMHGGIVKRSKTRGQQV